MKKMEINNRIYNVVTIDEYRNSSELYDNKFTAIQDHGIVLPIKQKNDFGAGYYIQPDSMVSLIKKPPENMIDEYSENKIIDYNNAKSIGDIIKNNEMLRDIQSEFIVDDENILNLTISDNDTPEMKALKSAINSKKADKSQYEDRFDQYQNDMRLLTKGTSITLGKLISICSVFDISAELVLKDKDGAPNPMNRVISIDLTEGRS